ncbi:hypothetical protein EDB19DRAFT_2025800 [Suillus lakei]|nr:hypothetical protein EDB19DRAFT_2025800 [Suillus lakei]
MASESTRGLPLDSANIMSTVLEGILYGTIWTFTYKQRIRDINRPVVVVATLLFVLSTAVSYLLATYHMMSSTESSPKHMIVGTLRLKDGLVGYGGTFHDGPAGFFADVTQRTFLTKNTIITVQTLLGDGMVKGLTKRSIDVTSSGNLSGSSSYHACCGLLAYRIWTIEHNVSGAYATKNKIKMPILRVLVDAALLYSAALCASLVCFALSNNGFYVIGDLIVPTISIAFYMVFIRVAISKNIRECLETTVCGGTNESDGRMQSSVQIGYGKNEISSWPTAVA